MRAMLPLKATLVLLWAVGLVLVSSQGAAQARFAGDRQPPSGPVSWLSTGDSYSSGVGVSSATGPCARSPEAFGPAAANVLRFASGWEISPVLHSACGGAEAAGFYRPGSTVRHSLWDLTLDVGASAGSRFDVITLTLGGNDVGFADILEECHLPRRWSDLLQPPDCDLDPGEVESQIRRLLEPGRFDPLGSPDSPIVGRGSLSTLLHRIAQNHLTDRGVLVIVGYPRLFAPSDEWDAWRGGRCGWISADDADALGSAAEVLDDTLRQAMNDAGGGDARIVYQPMLDAFAGRGRSHSLCGRGADWLNGLTLAPNGRLFDASFHPNEAGYAGMAGVVATRLNGLLGVSAPPTTTTTLVQPSSPEPSADTSSQVVVRGTYRTDGLLCAYLDTDDGSYELGMSGDRMFDPPVLMLPGQIVSADGTRTVAVMGDTIEVTGVEAEIQIDGGCAGGDLGGLLISEVSGG